MFFVAGGGRKNLEEIDRRAFALSIVRKTLLKLNTQLNQKTA